MTKLITGIFTTAIFILSQSASAIKNLPASDTWEDDFEIVENHEAAAERFAPLVQEWDYNITFNPHFVALAPHLLDLVDLSYFRSKSHRNDGESYKSWNIKTFEATRGLVFRDPKAGFVAFLNSDKDFLPAQMKDQAGPVMVIVFHGSINNADWFTNYEALKIDLLENHHHNLMLKGRAHSGFVRKYVSASGELMNLVDLRLNSLSKENRRKIKFYVTGHSQGAALAQLATAHLVQHLSHKHADIFENKLGNAKSNKVNGWFLAAPAVFDQVGKSFVEDVIIGRHNMIRQNVVGDVVPNATKILGSDYLKGIGYLLYQDGVATVKKAAALNWDGFKQNVLEGELSYAANQLTVQSLKLLVNAPHYVSATEYRGHGFTPALVNATEKELQAAAYEGHNHAGKSFFSRWLGY